MMAVLLALAVGWTFGWLHGSLWEMARDRDHRRGGPDNHRREWT